MAGHESVDVSGLRAEMECLLRGYESPVDTGSGEEWVKFCRARNSAIRTCVGAVLKVNGMDVALGGSVAIIDTLTRSRDPLLLGNPEVVGSVSFSISLAVYTKWHLNYADLRNWAKKDVPDDKLLGYYIHIFQTVPVLAPLIPHNLVIVMCNDKRINPTSGSLLERALTLATWCYATRNLCPHRPDVIAWAAVRTAQTE